VGLMSETDPRFAALERRVGLFLVASVLIIAAAIGVVGVRQGLFTPKTDVLFYDDSGRDLAEGLEVFTRGFRIGKVRRVRLTDEGKVEVTMAIDRALLRWVKKDSVARIVVRAFIGDSRIEISPGTPEAPPVPAGGVIAFVRDPDLTEIAAKVMEEVKPVLLAVKSLVGYLDDPQGDVKRSIANVRELSAGLAMTGERLYETLARLEARVDTVAGNLVGLSASLRGEVLPQLQGLVGDSRQLVGDTGGAVRSLDAFVKDDLRGLTASLQNELVPQLKALIAEADRAAVGAGDGVARVNSELPAILEKVQASLENVRVVTEQLIPVSQEAAEVLRQGGVLVEDSQALLRRTQELWPFRTEREKQGTTVDVDSYEIEKRPDPRGAAGPGGR